jgi:ABC-2 type transport system ATP-binding protein
MKLVELKKVSKTFSQSLFQKKEILKEIDFTVETGDFIVLKGANGAGKTTFLSLRSIGFMEC